MTDMTRLYLGHNQISDIKPLANLTNLTDLSLPNNQISDWFPVAHIEDVDGRP
jgi:internalin A